MVTIEDLLALSSGGPVPAKLSLPLIIQDNQKITLNL